MRCSVVRHVLAVSLAAGLVACGGGGSDSAAGDTTVVEGSTTASTATTAGSSTARIVVSDAATGYRCNLANFQTELLQRINALRATTVDCGTDAKTGHVYGVFQPTTALTWNAPLTNAAASHSADMVGKNYFSHVSQDGTTFDARITAAGYTWSTVAENIAAGQTTVAQVMDSWAASPGHCANLMNPAMTEVGVACVPGTSANTYGYYWTMDLGAPAR